MVSRTDGNEDQKHQLPQGHGKNKASLQTDPLTTETTETRDQATEKEAQQASLRHPLSGLMPTPASLFSDSPSSADAHGCRHATQTCGHVRSPGCRVEPAQYFHQSCRHFLVWFSAWKCWRCFWNLFLNEGFPGGAVVKKPPANAGDTDSIPGLGKPPEEGNGNPL